MPRGGAVDGRRYSVAGAGGVKIGLLTAGSGQDLLLVHGGASQIESWEPMWPALTARWRVTAMDRRGRDITGALASTLPAAEQVTLTGQGHEAVAVAPGVLVAELERYLGSVPGR